MKQLKLLLLLSIFFMFLCCTNDKNKQVIVQGYIIDSLTKKPIKKANVTVVCWYNAGWDKRDYQYIDTITNDEGYFKVKIDKGFKIIVASTASNYLPKYKEIKTISEALKTILNLVNESSDNTEDTVKINLRKYIINNTED